LKLIKMKLTIAADAKYLTAEEAKAFSIIVFGFGIPLVIQCAVALIIL
jgi:hypothetical protein